MSQSKKVAGIPTPPRTVRPTPPATVAAMISYPASLLVLPCAALLGVVYVNATRSRRPALYHGGRIGALVLTWVSPLATIGPGPAS